MIGQRQDVLVVDALRRENNFNFAVKGLVRVGMVDAYNPESGTLKETYQIRTKRFVKVDEARAFFIQIFDEYLDHMNADKNLAKLVKGYPFSSKNTEIQITILDEHGGPAGAPQIARIRNNDNSFIAYSYDKNDQRFIEIAQEPLY